MTIFKDCFTKVHEDVCKDQVILCGKPKQNKPASPQTLPQDAANVATPVDRNTYNAPHRKHDGSSVKSLGGKKYNLEGNNYVDTGSVRTLNALTSRPKSMDLVRLFQVFVLFTKLFLCYATKMTSKKNKKEKP